MSYILEALKKSERERELGAVPSLARIREDSPPPRRRWLPVALALSVSLFVAFAAWNFRHGLARLWPPGGAAQPAAEPGVPTAGLPRVSPPTASAPEVAPPAPVTTVAPEPVAIVAPATRPSATPGPSPRPTAPVAATPPPLDWDRLDPSFKAQLPGLAVNVLSYSEIPGKRFVMINQQIMREGQSLRGVELVGITRDGAVMRYRGTEFVLRP